MQSGADNWQLTQNMFIRMSTKFSAPLTADPPQVTVISTVEPQDSQKKEEDGERNNTRQKETNDPQHQHEPVKQT